MVDVAVGNRGTQDDVVGVDAIGLGHGRGIAMDTEGLDFARELLPAYASTDTAAYTSLIVDDHAALTFS